MKSNHGRRCATAVHRLGGGRRPQWRTKEEHLDFHAGVGSQWEEATREKSPGSGYIFHLWNNELDLTQTQEARPNHNESSWNRSPARNQNATWIDLRYRQSPTTSRLDTRTTMFSTPIKTVSRLVVNMAETLTQARYPCACFALPPFAAIRRIRIFNCTVAHARSDS